METDATRMCRLLVGLPTVNVIGVVDLHHLVGLTPKRRPAEPVRTLRSWSLPKEHQFVNAARKTSNEWPALPPILQPNRPRGQEPKTTSMVVGGPLLRVRLG